MDPFWFVMRVEESEYVTSPRVQHATEQSALTEAERLAKKHPGVKFAVLRLTIMVYLENEPRMVHATPHQAPSVYEQYPILPSKTFDIPQFSFKPSEPMTTHNKYEVDHVQQESKNCTFEHDTSRGVLQS